MVWSYPAQRRPSAWNLPISPPWLKKWKTGKQFLALAVSKNHQCIHQFRNSKILLMLHGSQTLAQMCSRRCASLTPLTRLFSRKMVIFLHDFSHDHPGFRLQPTQNQALLLHTTPSKHHPSTPPNHTHTKKKHLQIPPIFVPMASHRKKYLSMKYM